MRTLRDRPGNSRLRLILLFVAAVLFAIFLSANGIASVYTDWLWFNKLEIGSVWTTLIGTQLTMALVFGGLFFAIFWGNLVWADRVKPEIRTFSPEEELVERYHAMVGAQVGKIRFLLAAVFALIAGANTSSQWRTWLLFRNGKDFGTVDPMFNMDAGFYVFRLPMWTLLADWFFATLVLTLLVVLASHYLNGGIRAAAPGHRVKRSVKIQISVLIATLAVLRALIYWLDRFELVNSQGGAYDGALATDVLIQEPAYNLLALISIFCAGLVLYNIWRSGWGWPMVALGIWLISHFVIGSAFPLVYQRLRVENVQSQREAAFVDRNIKATRIAYGLDDSKIRKESLDAVEPLTAADVDEYADVLQNVPVVDAQLAVEEVTRSEAERKIFRFSDPLDVDRYMVDGQLRPVVLSARSLNVAEVGDSWENQHIIFTHGYGLAMASGYDPGPVENETAQQSDTTELNFLIQGLGETNVDEGLELDIDQPRVYYGENFSGYAVVGADRQESDYQTDNQSALFTYDGSGGVPIASALRRSAFALRFRELDMLISRSITGNSRVIYNRDIVERAEIAAPFLRFDRDPYPVVADGRIFWILNGYTTTREYPYSQSVDSSIVDSSLASGYNYIRNAVKVVVDAYDGDMDFYVIDEEDPIIGAWRDAFPDLFQDGSEVPAELRAHFRYPSELFTVQTDMWSDYVVSNPTEFIQGDVAWSIAAQPRTEAQTEESETAPLGPMNPQYLMARLPGEDTAEYVLQRAFVPRSGAGGNTRPELEGIMMARSDGANYGELVLLDLPGGEIEAPDLVHSEIRKNGELTQFIKDKAGAKVKFGEMSIVAAGNSVVYIRPVYVEANSQTAVPELQRIVAFNDSQISMANTVEDAINGIVGRRTTSRPTTSTDSGNGSDTSGGTSGGYSASNKSLVELIADAEQFLLLAEETQDTQPEEAARLRARAQEALDRAGQIVGGQETKVPQSPAGT